MDLEVIVAMEAVLPLLSELKGFVKVCQLRGVFVLDLLRDLQQLRKRVKALYIHPQTRYSAVANPCFTALAQLLSVDGTMPEGKPSRLTWVGGVLHVRLARGCSPRGLSSRMTYEALSSQTTLISR